MTLYLLRMGHGVVSSLPSREGGWDLFGHICQVPSPHCLSRPVRRLYPRFPRVQ